MIIGRLVKFEQHLQGGAVSRQDVLPPILKEFHVWEGSAGLNDNSRLLLSHGGQDRGVHIGLCGLPIVC